MPPHDRNLDSYHWQFYPNSTMDNPKLRGLSLVIPIAFLSWPANAQSARVRVEPSATYTQTMNAVRDKQHASIEYRSIRVKVVTKDEMAREFIVRMLYDSQTKLFLRGISILYQDHSPEWDARQYSSVATVYLSQDKLIVFTTVVLELRAFLDSTEHEDSIERAQNSILQFLEKEPFPAHKWKTTRVDYMKEKPRDF